MTILLRAIAALVATHIGLAVVAATAISLHPEYPQLTRVSAVLALVAIAGGAGYALWSLWRLRWGGAVAIGLGYTVLLVSQLLYLARGSIEFSPGSAMVFGVVAAIVLSPQARRACQRGHVTLGTEGARATTHRAAER